MANIGYCRFLAVPEGEGFTIDPVKVAADASSTVCLSCVPFATRPVFHQDRARDRGAYLDVLKRLLLVRAYGRLVRARSAAASREDRRSLSR